tara:strand:+ start:53126 stop:54178 length:1053 start_codon:yes stop_codon:yes gene_type:complete
MKKLTVACAVAMVTLSGAANAKVTISFGEDIFFDLTTVVAVTAPASAYDRCFGPGLTLCTGANDADLKTGVFDDIGFTGMLATSIYDFSDNLVTGQFFDTNKAAELAAAGIPSTPETLAAVIADGPGGANATTLSLVTPIHPTQVDIDGLNPISDSNLGAPGADDEGFGSTWHIDTEFRIDGVLGAVLPDYQSGSFNLIFDDGVAPAFSILTATFERDIVGLAANGVTATAELFFNIDFAFAGLFWLDDGVNPAVDLSTVAGVDPTTGPELRVAFNVDPATPTADQLGYVTSAASFVDEGAAAGQADKVVIRQTTLDGSAQIPSIPEPGTLALFGLGLVGLGAAASRKKA